MYCLCNEYFCNSQFWIVRVLMTSSLTGLQAIKAWQRELGVYLARFQIGPSLQFKAKLLVLKQEFISVFS